MAKQKDDYFFFSKANPKSAAISFYSGRRLRRENFSRFFFTLIEEAKNDGI